MGIVVPVRTNISVEQLAGEYAARQLQDQQLTPEQRPILYKRITYDAEVTAFNAATIATIITLAITLITNSVVWCVLFAGCYLVRTSIEKAIDLTGVYEQFAAGDHEFSPEVMLAFGAAMPENIRRGVLTDFLHIENEGWHSNQYKLLDFVVWKNWAPRADLQQQPAPVPQQQA